ncbi:hypothetical protein [Nevskia sp.]|uniref:hypothetical protein n=1 Tax=Nevskia sp. TaxID=1929292 RepID=UPI0025F4F560|nr:hypothetical protein [Nevskia sp.]
MATIRPAAGVHCSHGTSIEASDHCTDCEAVDPPSSSLTVTLVCSADAGVVELMLKETVDGLTTSLAACVLRVTGRTCDPPDTESVMVS